MMKYIFTLLITTITALYADVLFAGKTNDIINRERLRRDQIVEKMTKKRAAKENDFEKYKKISEQKMRHYKKLVTDIKNKHVKKAQHKGLIKPPPQVVVFVSFSMPNLSLKQIIRGATRYKIPVVIRGLYESSFRQTMEKIFDLVKEDNKGGILINPLWFKKYGINTVPAVVVNYGGIQRNTNNAGVNSKNSEKKEREDFDVVYGNIPIKRALEIIAEKGSGSKFVKEILSRDGV